MCKVAVGRSYWVDENGKQSVLKNAFKLPAEYDSFCVTKPLPTAPVDPNEYCYEYVMTDETLVLACFVAEVVATEKIDRLELALAPHDLDHLQFFDTSLGVPVSIRDKMIGSHAEEDPNSIVSFKQLHQATSASVRHMLAARASERKRIKQQLLSLNQKIDSVHRSYAAVESKIYDMLGENLSRLHEQKTCWEQLLQSDVVPLWANIGHVDRSQSLLNLARASLTPLQFFQFFEGRGAATADNASRAVGGSAAGVEPLPFATFPSVDPGLRIRIRGMMAIESPLELQAVVEVVEQQLQQQPTTASAAAPPMPTGDLTSVIPTIVGGGVASNDHAHESLAAPTGKVTTDPVDWEQEDEVEGALQMHDKVEGVWKVYEVKLKLRTGMLEWYEDSTKEGELSIVDCGVVSAANREENPRVDQFSLVLEGEKLHFRSQGGSGRGLEEDARWWFDAITYSICYTRKALRRAKGLLCAYR
jgi:hypothetical protein